MLHGLILAKLKRNDEAIVVLDAALTLCKTILAKTPELQEAQCNEGIVLMTLALVKPIDNRVVENLFNARKVFVKVFEDTIANGVVSRYRYLIDEIRNLDQLHLIELCMDGIENTLSERLAKTGIFVELHVDDFDRAVAFYKLLGFVIALRSDDPDKYLTMRRKRCLINFYEESGTIQKHTFFGKFPPSTQRGYGVEIVIPVDDIEADFDAIKRSVPDEAIMEPLTVRSWGKKDFRLIDPFGYYLRFTEPIQWLDPNP